MGSVTSTKFILATTPNTLYCNVCIQCMHGGSGLCTFYYSVPPCSMHNCSSLACSMHGYWMCATSLSVIVIPVSACSIHCTCTLQVKFQMIHLNPLRPVAPTSIMRLSASWCNFLQCPLELGSASAERVRQGKWVGVPEGCKTAWLHLGLVVQTTWLALGGSFLA